MKKDFFIHARRKFKWDDKKYKYVNDGLTCSSLSREEKDDNINAKLYDKKIPNVIDVKGGVTVAVIKQPTDDIIWSVSKCSDYDVYSKKLGRLITSNRIKNDISNNHIRLTKSTFDMEFEDAMKIGKELVKQIDKKGYEFFINLSSEELLSLK